MIEWVFGGLVLLSLRKQNGHGSYGIMTPERETMYLNALEHLKDPERLRKLAGEFEKEGLPLNAKMLRGRADWRDRSPETILRHNELFDKAMKSVKVDGILEVARAFESMTATVKAKQLRDRAEEVQRIQLDLATKAAVEAAATKAEENISEDNHSNLNGHTPPQTKPEEKVEEKRA